MTATTAPRLIILGATSEIAEAIARLYAEEGARLVLAGRNGAALEEIGADLKCRGAQDVAIFADDLAETRDVETRFAAMAKRFDGVDIVLVMYAEIADQLTLELDLAKTTALLNTNLVSATLWMLAAAAYLETQKSGVLLASGALAGDRGRRSNYIYGAAKAGLATIMQGIAHRLHGSGARASVVKFGPVATPMTAGQPGCASVMGVAREVKRALTYGSAAAFYAPWWWRFAMWPTRLAPDFIMHRTRL